MGKELITTAAQLLAVRDEQRENLQAALEVIREAIPIAEELDA